MNEAPKLNSLEEILQAMYIKQNSNMEEYNPQWNDEIDETMKSKKVSSNPINISKNTIGNDVFIQIQALGFEDNDISVNTKVDEDGYKLVIEGSQKDEDFEDGFEYSTKQFNVEPFKSVIKVSREIAEGNFNIDLGAGILTIHCLPNMQASNIKKIF